MFNLNYSMKILLLGNSFYYSNVFGMFGIYHASFKYY